jgi:hypothetical protein
MVVPVAQARAVREARSTLPTIAPLVRQAMGLTGFLRPVLAETGPVAMVATLVLRRAVMAVQAASVAWAVMRMHSQMQTAATAATVRTLAMAMAVTAAMQPQTRLLLEAREAQAARAEQAVTPTPMAVPAARAWVVRAARSRSPTAAPSPPLAMGLTGFLPPAWAGTGSAAMLEMLVLRAEAEAEAAAMAAMVVLQTPGQMLQPVTAATARTMATAMAATAVMPLQP